MPPSKRKRKRASTIIAQTPSPLSTLPPPTPSSLTPSPPPPAPPEETLPCLFTVTQLLLPGPSPHPNTSIPNMANVFIVRPTSIWNSLTRYKILILEGSAYHINDNVEIALPNGQHRIARVLEIRGHSEQHVYVRLFWFYTANDLPHSMRLLRLDPGELLASNDMDIVNAATVAGQAEVMCCVRGSGALIPEDGLFWRRTFDVATGEVAEFSQDRLGRIEVEEL